MDRPSLPTRPLPTRPVRTMALGAALLALIGCRDQETPAETPSAAPATSPTARPDSPAARPDPGPLVERKTGTRAAKTLPAVSIEVDAVEKVGDAWWIRGAVPSEPGKLVLGAVQDARVLVEGPRYGLAVPASDGRMPDRPWLYVRLTGAEPLPPTLNVQWRQAALLEGEPGQLQQMTLVGLAEAPPFEGLQHRGLEAMSRWFGAHSGPRGQRQPFWAFAAARLDAMARAAAPTQAARVRVRSAGVLDLMQLYTGMTSVEEALQTDRGLRVPPEDPGASLPLSAIEPLVLPGHPWGDMIAAAPGGGDPVVEPLARMAPHDFLYVHVAGVGDAMALVADLERMIAPIAQSLEARAGPAYLVDRYATRLGLVRGGILEALGPAVVSSAALVASDPFFREGTDATLLLRTRNTAAVDAALEAFAGQLGARHGALQEETITIDGQTVRRRSTPDRVVDQYRAIVGETVVLSTSKPALARVLDSANGRSPSLATSGDFRYFRTRYPAGAAGEDVFAFLSDAFVGHVISPRVKVLSARRGVALGAMRAALSSIMLHGWFEGRPATAEERAGASPWIDARPTGDAGGLITVDDLGRACHPTFGCLGAATPLIELPLETVSEREKAAFARFASGYQRYWQEFIDPIAFSVVRDGDRVTVEGRMMPIIQQSGYNELADLVGESRVVPGSLGDGLGFVFGVARDASLRTELDRLGRTVIGNREVGIGWLGDWVAIGVGDRSGLWDVALTVGEIPSVDGRRAYRDPGLRKRTLERLPLYVAAHVSDRLALAATLTAIRGFVQTSAPGVVDWKPAAPHGEVEVVQITEKLTEESDNRVSVEYAIAKDVLLVSLDRATLEAAIDTVLAGQGPKTDAGDGPPQQAMLVIKPRAGESWLVRTLLGMFEHLAIPRLRAARRGFEALARGQIAGAQDDRERALRWLGAEPRGPHGRLLTLTEGQIQHPLYGTEVAPAWPAVPVPDSPIGAFLGGLESAHVTVGFDGEGLHRALVTTLSWRKAQAPR